MNYIGFKRMQLGKEFGKYGNLHYEEILEYRDEKFKEKN